MTPSGVIPADAGAGVVVFAMVLAALLIGVDRVITRVLDRRGASWS